MISSRWPRPIGTRLSMALRPVCIGSCTERRGMMPGAFTSTRARRGALIGALPSIGVPRASTTRPHSPLADRHFDDGVGALDGVAFLDAAVVTENDDADIVGFEVQRHAPDTAGEFDHFAGLDIVQAVDAGDAVAHRQDLADFRDRGVGAEVLDLLLQDGGDFRGTNIHNDQAPFMIRSSPISLVRIELSISREPILTTRPPSRLGSTLALTLTFAANVWLSFSVRRSVCSAVSGCAEVTSTDIWPRRRASSFRNASAMAERANRRRFLASTPRKLSTTGDRPAALPISATAFPCESLE